jgi:tRNA-Thr(GGU) m(6)t(6)A37 methyltransferase TsaA
MNQSDGNTADYQLIQLKPVGVVRNQSKDPSWGSTLGALGWRERAARMKKQGESVSELVIDSSLEGILDGIDDFSHIMVLYWAHLIPPERRSITRVHPMGNKDFPLVGVFATGSPVRPNSILTTVVRLLQRQGNILKVTGLDALDGSPILDIKPYFRATSDADEIKVPDWMRDIHQTFAEEAPSE